MKGVVLAGGTGSRLDPLTRITNKHLLPVYDRPMVLWALEALVEAGVKELMLVTGGTHAGEFLRLLGNGHEWGIERLFYAYQERPGGIAEALGLAEQFVAGPEVVDQHSVRRAGGGGQRPKPVRQSVLERVVGAGVEESLPDLGLAVPAHATCFHVTIGTSIVARQSIDTTRRS